jgi:hypothetical protein
MSVSEIDVITLNYDVIHYKAKALNFAVRIINHLKTKNMENTNKPADAFTITGDWTPQATKLKEKYAALTDADLKFEKGKENDLINRIGNKINKKREEVISLIKTGNIDKA